MAGAGPGRSCPGRGRSTNHAPSCRSPLTPCRLAGCRVGRAGACMAHCHACWTQCASPKPSAAPRTVHPAVCAWSLQPRLQAWKCPTAGSRHGGASRHVYGSAVPCCQGTGTPRLRPPRPARWPRTRVPAPAPAAAPLAPSAPCRGAPTRCAGARGPLPPAAFPSDGCGQHLLLGGGCPAGCCQAGSARRVPASALLLHLPPLWNVCCLLSQHRTFQQGWGCCIAHAGPVGTPLPHGTS